MASLGAKFSLKSLIPGAGEGEHNPLTMSDDQILEEIISTHVHSDTKLDVGPLFSLVDNTLTRSTHIVDSVVQGSQVSLEHIDDKSTQANFSSPLCTLRQISSEMQCKPPGEQVAHKTTMAILNKLSHYEWDAKAVLTLAAFAMEYGELWLLAQLQPTDLLAKSVAMLKRVPVLTKPASLQKHRQAIVELNSLIKSTLLVIELIFELEQLSSYDTKDVPALVTATENIPLDVYWAIITIVAIVTQLDCLTTESEHRQELSHYGQKINIILSKLRNQISQCRQQIEVTKMYYKIRKTMQTPTETMEVLKLLIFSSDVSKPLYDGSSKTTVSIDVLKKKNVYLFVSTLDITEEELSVVLKIHESIKTKNQTEQYKIVWVPIVEEWTEQLRKKFELLKTKMPFFVVEHFGSVAGFKYIKEEWQFKKKPMVVTMNHQGKILHPNAFHLVQAWGFKAFPFTKTQEEEIHTSRQWVAPIVSQIHPSISTWIKEEKYIFFYGGHDKEWVQQFAKYATAMVNDALLKEKKILIELFHVEKENKNIFSSFWSGIESLFVTKVHKTVDDDVTKEVQKMLSYKNETGWALMSKGSEVILTGHGTTILKTVAEYEKWKEFIVSKGFEWSFKEYHDKAANVPHRCSHLEIPNVAGKMPERIRCPECPKTMEIFITYKCCHEEATSNAAR
ncbi:protein SIEVE ELEMENT OCCLUSION B-like [Prosopis cineraria]|uniref:protein SIEVE ELEMENT OCCLUSION B-like n=1 Tax=Prosopis cineraria TaxID=364024 RepID=UPI0024102665|nr:protein SIEVE ELEMENT OCCLUSION B-like [Prosopis cineraria]